MPSSSSRLAWFFAKFFCNITPWASFPLGLVANAVRNGVYEEFIATLKKANVPSVLPDQLNGITVKFLTYYSEYIGKICQIATLVGIIVATRLESYFYTGAFLSILAYDKLDKMNYIPHKVTEFMEAYISKLFQINTLMTGTLTLRLFTTISLTSNIPYIYMKYLALFEKALNLIYTDNGFSIAESEAPLYQKKNMTAEEIQTILAAPKEAFEINPSHCSKYIPNALPVDLTFDKFNEIFNTISWEEKYELIKPKLRDDDKFCQLIRQEIQNAFETQPPSLNHVKENFEALVIQLATNSNLSKEIYLAQKLEESMKQLSCVLSRNSRTSGSQIDLQYAIDACAKILAYIQNANTPSIEKEDILLKLAVEGGTYCAAGIKRAAEEIVRENIHPQSHSNSISDPQSSYELQIMSELQNKRFALLQIPYQALLTELSQTLLNDVHAFNFYFPQIALGFYPLNASQKAALSLTSIWAWKITAATRQILFENYKNGLNTVFKQTGMIHLTSYISTHIHSNPQLTPQQRSTILDGWVNDEPFCRLALVIMGVLRLKTTHPR